MTVKALKFTKNHGNGRFSRKKANFTVNVTAVKSWIMLVPNHDVQSDNHCWLYPKVHTQ